MMSLKWVSLLFILTNVIKFSSSCNTITHRHCPSLNNYQLCYLSHGDVIYIGAPQSCPDETICDEINTIPCREIYDETTTISTMTSAVTASIDIMEKPVTVPCTVPGVYPGPECNQYYFCRTSSGVLQWKLYNCPEGYAFDARNKGCGPVGSVKCSTT